ncbi:hypothetical protein [Pseudoalteromonas sp.]|uniref:hypothetical protein n=1 Tax=unclassified Pseudoalteromonas TaxID=194690 RepID=UPI001E003FA4|nr:hypothetical protein [Pseudoalteromonas sp.]NRA78300.1 hypothetical protein [Pseudoalteromonas sp.]
MNNLKLAKQKADELATLIGEAYFEANSQGTAAGNLLAMHIEPEIKALADLERKLSLLMMALDNNK